MSQQAELSCEADSENYLGGSSETMYYIGLDVHKRLPAITTEGEEVKTSALLVADKSVGHDGGIEKPATG